jgi:DNA helicase-4
VHEHGRQTWGTRHWALEVEGQRVVLRTTTPRNFAGSDLSRLKVERRWLRWQVVVDGRTRYKGLTQTEARSLRAELARLVDGYERSARERARDVRLRMLHAGLVRELEQLVLWDQHVHSFFDEARRAQRWIARDQLAELQAMKPDPSILLNHPDPDLRDSLSPRELEALSSFGDSLWPRRKRTNSIIAKLELETHKDFFDRIEKSALTAEQAEAVVRFDNRVQIIAAAGSGKTSVMVARAAYAVMRGFVAPDRILLLAFNKNAAAELQERIEARFDSYGIDGSGVRASTFHSFGLSVIGKATGSKPRLAPWLEGGKDTEKVQRIVDELRDTSPSFRLKWDLFRLLFAGMSEEATWWDPETKVIGHRTFRGETVRSAGEKIIADFLYLKGVNYQYERAYPHDVSSATHSQYRPDFYYPDVDLWHEHWAVGADGRVVEAFAGYDEGMKWKRGVHLKHGTALMETTWGEIMSEAGLENFDRQLRDRGVTTSIGLDDTERSMSGDKPLGNAQLARLIRTFMQHVKSNSLDRGAVKTKVSALPPGPGRYRAQLFCELYWPIHERWQSHLDAENCVDFEDMLAAAAGALERGSITPCYDMVLVDEFQDASSARARLVKALVAGPGRYLLTVGDDWQSIYRFAGADLSVVTDFEKLFGRAETLGLQTTFRSTQVIADVASSFVAKNPRQLKKTVTSSQGAGGAPIRVARISAADPSKPEPELAHAVARYLERIASDLSDGRIDGGRQGRVAVDVLGRYRHEEDLLPRRTPAGLDVQFRTIHRAKGLEADYVLIPRMLNGTKGFPSQIEDDPLLDLVMPSPDSFPLSEERRLLYVALTRARREVAMITVVGRESPFIVELLSDGLVTFVGETATDGPAGTITLRPCPRCWQGLLQMKPSRKGDFLGCSRFPRCTHSQPM